MLRLLAGLARWTLAGLVAFWLLLGATAGVLHGLIVPRIGDYRGKLEQLAAQALGVPVHIGAVAAFSDGLVPSLELREVQLLDSQGQTALRLPRVLVAISARSLWRLGVEQIVVESPELQLTRRSDGRWEIAGLLQRDDRADDGAALDWVLNQPEIAVRGGTLRWLDALRGSPMQQLHGVDLVLRGGRWRHALRLDAQLDPAQGGGAVKVVGQLREPLLSPGGKPWERWHGQWYAQGRLQQLPVLPWPKEWGVAQVQAAGDFRAWVDVRKGTMAGVTVDLQLPHAEVQWVGEQPAPLALKDVAGRLDLQTVDGGWQARATGWTFALEDGRRWPQSALTVRWPQAGGALPHALEADFLDLAMAQALAARMPLPETVAAPLQRWALQGQARDLRLHWQPATTRQPLRYQAQGQVQALQLLDTREDAERLPGVQGLSASFTLDQQGGSADVSMRQGALEFPGIFEEPRIPIDQLQAQLRWSQDAHGRWAVQLPQAQFANADAQGHLKAQWQMGADAAQRLPGTLSLDGVLTRANGARVHRYLPLEVPADARHYVRDSVRSGQASGVRFKVQGPLEQFPFDHHPAGVFQITAPVRDVVYDYVPPALRKPGEAPWPLISRLAGELVFDKNSMQVRNASGLFGEGSKVPMEGIQASIPDLSYPVVKVKGQGKAPLPAWLEVVARSPLAGMTDHVLDRASAAGPATLDLELTLPIDHIHQARVQGAVGLQGNRLRLRPDMPELQDARGAVRFSEQGFEIADVQAQSMGGKVRVGGGMKLGKGAPVLDVRARGRATAEGLRSDGFLEPVTALARHASGAADYEVQVGLQRGLPQIMVRSSLQGMAVQLPAPLGKSAEAVVPLQVTQRLTPQAAANAQAPLRDMLQVHVQDRAALTYVFDPNHEASPVVAGWLQLGGDVGPAGAWPATLDGSQEVQALAQLDALDIDAWLALLPEGGKAGAGGPPTLALESFLPQTLALRVGSLRLHGRDLYDVVAGLSHADAVWRGNVQSRQLGGYLEYREPGVAHPQGMVFARLSHLLLPEGAGEQADKLLQSQPRQMPALDIVVKEFALAGRELGNLAVQARNVRRDGSAQWVLEHLDLTLPEAVLTTSGTWGGPDEQRRRTQLRFALQLKDSGALLGRLAMPGVVRGGKGQLEGTLSWRGAPIAPDWRSMSGQLHLDVGQGQFLKAEPGLAKLLSVLSLQSLPRRIGLDFRDVFSSGFAFDFVRGDVAVTQGVARTNNLQMKGVNAAVLMEGQASLVDETQQLRVVVVPEINAMTASLVASAINPLIGLGSFLAQAVLRGPLIAAATREFEITGSWADPQVKTVSKRATPPDTAATTPAEAPPPATEEVTP
ncbi:MAG: TIGR02099 family protein [Acidovorax sp.]|nr:TIGR02099 family protein [Acidovorax sp.]